MVHNRSIDMRDCKGLGGCSFYTEVLKKWDKSVVSQCKPCHTDVADVSKETVGWQEVWQNHVIHNAVDTNIREADTVFHPLCMGVAHLAFQQVNKRDVPPNNDRRQICIEAKLHRFCCRDNMTITAILVPHSNKASSPLRIIFSAMRQNGLTAMAAFYYHLLELVPENSAPIRLFKSLA